MTGMESGSWIRACAASEIEAEDVVRFQHAGHAYAIYHTSSGFYATADLCTHGGASLSDGLVVRDVIECPLHQGRFHIPTGKAMTPPACRALKTYATRVIDGDIFIAVLGTMNGVP